MKLKDITKEVNNLDGKKASKSDSIPVEPLLTVFNNCIKEFEYDEDLKFADLLPISKSGDTTYKKNYPSASLLPTVSKLYEKILHKQIVAIVDQFLSPFLCGYRKGYTIRIDTTLRKVTTFLG